MTSLRALLLAVALLASTAAAADEPGVAAREQRASVEALVDRYYAVWSRADFEGYAALFHPKAFATIQGPAGERRFERAGFLAHQRKARHTPDANRRKRLGEPAVRFAHDMGYAVVFWKIDRGSKPATKGWDHFALEPAEGGWQIIQLTIHENAPDEAPGP